MKLSDGVHTLYFTNPYEERIAIVSGNGSVVEVVPPGTVMTYKDDPPEHYEGPEGYPRFYPFPEHDFIWTEPGGFRRGIWT